MKALLLFVVVTAAGVAGGCTAQACPSALLTGVLAELNGELVVMPSPGRPARVTWPDGHSLRHDGETLVLVNVFGAVVAREGDSVRLGGGQDQDQSGAFQVCGLFEVAPFNGQAD